MRLLAFESSAKAASAALLCDGMLEGESYLNCGQTHSSTLTRLAENLLASCALRVEDVDAVAVASGPGSLTGIRIGVAAAKGFAWGRELPLFGVSTLEAMAVGCRHLNGIICCSMDARRAQVYNALFRAENGELTRLTPDRAISLEQLKEDLEKYSSNTFLVGDGAQLCYNELEQELSFLSLLPEHIRLQRAASVALTAWPRLTSGERPSAEELVPNYLRLSQAERERLERMKKEN